MFHGRENDAAGRLPCQTANGEVVGLGRSAGEHHLIRIGLITVETPPAAQQNLLDEKRSQFEQAQESGSTSDQTGEDNYPKAATLCKKCNTRATIFLDGCETCLSCGYSKCG